MQLIINIPDTAYETIQAIKNMGGSNEGTLENVLIKAVEDGTPIPDNATNGDMMWKIFNISLDDFKKTWGGGEFTDNWWNAPYQKGGKDEVN